MKKINTFVLYYNKFRDPPYANDILFDDEDDEDF